MPIYFDLLHMENAINSLHIQNFKSIRSALLHPRQVNLFIGEPNVGKSTVLEAISLLGSFAYETKKKFMRSFIRCDEPRQMFHNNLPTSSIRIETDREVCLVGGAERAKGFSTACSARLPTSSCAPSWASRPCRATGGHHRRRCRVSRQLYDHIASTGELPASGLLYTEFDQRGVTDQPGGNGRFLTSSPPWYPQPVKPYRYKRNPHLHRRYGTGPAPTPRQQPGANAGKPRRPAERVRRAVCQAGPAAARAPRNRPPGAAAAINGRCVCYPYSNSGDTLQVYGFYLAALESNHDTVLLLEEPETHSFPAYVTRLAERIATQRTNQFFVTTHSPYLFNEILEDMVPYENRVPELAVFVMHHNGYESQIRQLTDEEVRGLRRDSIDVFCNLDQLGHKAKEPAPRHPMFQAAGANLRTTPAV